MKSRLYVPNKGIPIEYGESKIYTINDEIYKEFKDNISLATRRRKKERIKYLQQFETLKQYYPEIKYFVEYLFSLYIKGYVAKKEDTKSLDSIFIPIEEKIKLLKQTREILDMFKSIGLMYYDIHLGNIKCRLNGQVLFFDIDSILYVDESKPDITPYGFNIYECYGGKLDEKFQRIKFNIFTRNVLSSCQEVSLDEVGQEMMEYQLNEFEPSTIFANENLLDHVLTK